jgi:hypothetical protein
VASRSQRFGEVSAIFRRETVYNAVRYNDCRRIRIDKQSEECAKNVFSQGTNYLLITCGRRAFHTFRIFVI